MKGKLIVISGFSGSGKGTIVKKLISDYDNFCISISATTRKIREGEIDGVSYFFVSHEQFTKMIDNNELLEYAQYVDNYYGTPKKYVEDNLDNGKNVILEIEILGALQIKKIFKDAILIFIIPPSIKELYNRLKMRNTETEEQIKNRMNRALMELDKINDYNYIIMNDDLDIAVNDIVKICNNNYIYDKNKYNDVLNQMKSDIKEEKYV